MSGTAEASGTTTETTEEATVKIEVTDEEPKEGEGEGTDETGAPGADPDVEAGPDGEGEAPMPERKRTPQQIAAEQRLKHTQKQVDEVVDIMKTNVEKVLERDSKLAELDYRSDKLQEGASMFEKQAGALKNKFWLENMKMMIVMGIMGLIVVVIIYYKYFAE